MEYNLGNYSGLNSYRSVELIKPKTTKQRSKIVGLDLTNMKKHNETTESNMEIIYK